MISALIRFFQRRMKKRHEGMMRENREVKRGPREVLMPTRQAQPAVLIFGSWVEKVRLVGHSLRGTHRYILRTYLEGCWAGCIWMDVRTPLFVMGWGVKILDGGWMDWWMDYLIHTIHAMIPYIPYTPHTPHIPYIPHTLDISLFYSQFLTSSKSWLDTVVSWSSRPPTPT